MNNNFYRDLNKSYKYEKLTERLFRYISKHPIKDVIYNNDYKYDLHINLMNNKSYYIEVKADFKSKLTGNICFEINSLQKSEANIFVYYLYTDNCVYAYIFNRYQINKMIEMGIKIKGGDYNQPLSILSIKNIDKNMYIRRIKINKNNF